MTRRSERKGRSRDRAPTRSWLLTFLLVCAVAVVVVAMNVPAASFTSLELTRNTSADVVSDQSGILGLQDFRAGSGTTLDLASLTNQFGQNVSITVSLLGSSGDRADLIVNGVNYGDTVTLSDLGNQAQRTVEIAVYCSESYVGKQIEYEVSVDGVGVTGTASRAEVIGQYCISWYESTEWNNAVSEEGVVHAAPGDHNATDIELGAATTGTNLVAYWPLDEDSGTTVTDVVGNHDGTLQSGSNGQEGILSTTGYNFAETEYATIGDAVNDGQFSISFWFKPTQSGWSGTLYDMSSSSENFYVTAGATFVRFEFEASNKRVFLQSSGVAADEWHHIVVTGEYRGSGPHKLYVDGTLVDSSTKNMNKGKPSFPTPRIANENGNGDTAGGFTGRMDEIRAYDTILSDSEVRDIYSGGPAGGSVVWNGSLTTAWDDTATIDVSHINLTDVVSRVPSGTALTAYVETDTNGDGVADETSDPIALDGSAGPFEITGLSTDASRFRLRVELNTTDITNSPCFSAATLAEDVTLTRGSFSGCGKTDVSTNEQPVANFTYSPSNPAVTDNVTFDASDSFDPDGTITEYRWDFQSDGTIDATTTDPTVEHSYDSAGTFEVKLAVVDNASATNTTTKTITVSAVELVWESAVDWDQRVTDGGVVHDGFGDHNTSWIELGYPASGTDLVDYWHLDEDSGTTAEDVGPGDRDGTVNGDVTLGAEGVLNTTAFTFDGNGDYVDVGSLEGVLGDTASLSVWLKTTQTGDDTHWQAPGITGIEVAGDSNDTFWGWINASGHIGIQFGDDPGAISTTPINDGTWHHVVLTYDNATGETKVYVDGQLEDTATTAITSVHSFSSIGRIEDTAGTPGNYSGTLDEARIYDTVLNGTDVDRLFHGTTPTAVAWEGDLLTSNKSVDSEIDPDRLQLQGVNAEVPPGTNLTVWIQSDPDGDGVFEEESGAISLDGSTSTYSVPDGSLATNSTTFRLEIRGNTTDHLVRPRLDAVEIGTFELNDPPTASFTASCSGTSCSFDASGSSDPDGTIESYEWDFGDGNTGTGVTVDHTYATPGTYTVNLTITDDDGATDSVEKTITINVVWASPGDWDAATSETGVVHQTFGDRNASIVTMGTGTSDANLVSFWPFDEDSGTTVNDVVGTNDGSLNGVLNGQVGVLASTGYDFPTSEYVTVGDAINDGQFSISMWFKPDNFNWDGTLYDMTSGRNNFYVTGTRDYLIWDFSVKNQEVRVRSDMNMPGGEWYHVVVTGEYSSSGPHKIFVNGVEQASSQDKINKGKPNLATPRIGDETGDASGTRGGFDGKIDEVRVFDTKLSASEVSALYDAASSGSLITDARTIDSAVDPTNLTLEHVEATVPSNTNLTVYVQSDPDGDGVFEEESAAISLDGSGGPYDVSGGSLSTNSDTYRLRIEFNSSDVTKAPELDGIELEPP